MVWMLASATYAQEMVLPHASNDVTVAAPSTIKFLSVGANFDLNDWSNDLEPEEITLVSFSFTADMWQSWPVLGCMGSFTFLLPKKGNDDYDRLFAKLLIAKGSNRPITITVEECMQAGNGNNFAIVKDVTAY